ncbi:MAG: hypothetical protein AVDCRST_MAG35-2 [uncultured Quadrisphaera sp.]|uniref:N-acetylmuramoyl-L-alanine amidase n=1 Tax=uncultured Quadrisphaera sp. TaxID=904978 RepID=A0A6J4NBT3_9ACTN|nr:MAG: hypothetical protein AVDCRST_MAG35-2 [uncultured Quadrisphaera sp.]
MSASPIRWRRASTATGLAAIVAVGALGAGSAQAVSGFAFDERLAGPTRLETAVAASKALVPEGSTSQDVVIVSQFAPIDGLTASYLAGLKNAPILFTETNSMSPVTVAELERLKPENIWIVGGFNVISADLEASWKPKYKVTRYGGTDRYETAAKVAQADFAVTGFEPERVFIANGIREADALAVGPIAYAKNYPILLTEPGNVPQATKDALATLQTPARTVVGGTAVVSDSTYTALGANARLAGADRQATAVAVAEYAVASENFTFKNAALAGGNNQNAVDALVAAPLTGSTGTPLLFVQGNASVSEPTRAYLDKHSANLDDRGFVFGGTNAVSEKAVLEANAAAQ